MIFSCFDMQNAPTPQLPIPSIPQLLLFFLLLGWLVVGPIAVGLLSLALPAAWPALAANLLVTAILAGLLFAPILGFAGLVRWRQWANMQPFAVALIVTGLYLVAAVGLRAVTEPTPAEPRQLSLLSETTLGLTALTLAASMIGGIGLWRAGAPKRLLPHAFGFDRPPLAGLLAALAALAVLTIGWPLTGSLGDSWVSLLIVLHALALSLPEEILFRGAVLGIITYNFQQRKALAAFIAMLIYIAFTPSLIVPHGDWARLVLLIAAVPFALLLTELRALTGSIWAGVFFATAYRAFPLLFTDPRVELPLITEPWQTAARLWLVAGAGGLALVL
ncbi:MAG: CPBP family glutamic-type intramembrane protease, partial [Chloroflexota bacterium]